MANLWGVLVVYSWRGARALSRVGAGVGVTSEYGDGVWPTMGDGGLVFWMSGVRSKTEGVV